MKETTTYDGGLKFKLILISETVYVDGIIKMLEKTVICSTPIREQDLCIEKIFIFEPNEK